MVHRIVLAATAVLCCTAAVQTQEAPKEPPQERPPLVNKISLPMLESLEIGGEYRLRFESRYNYHLDRSQRVNDDFFGQRVRVHFDVQATKNIRAFVQFQDVRNWGDETNTTDASANQFDVHQGYMEIDDLLSGNGRLGRQELAYGEERLVGSLNWLNQGRAFDGYRHRWEQDGEYSVDAFWVNLAETSVMTPQTYTDAYFMGVYATLDSIENGVLDGYFLHLNNEMLAGGGNENRSTVGLRYVQTAGMFEFGTELATQFGTTNGAEIPIGETHGIHVRAVVRSEQGLKPFAHVEYNRASGDDPTTGKNERFNTLFPTAHRHMGIMDWAFWENVQHFSGMVGCIPDPRSKLLAGWHMFQAAEDDVFRGPLTPQYPAGSPGFYPGGAGLSKDIGQEIDIVYHRTFDTNPAKTHLQFGYGIFFPGQGVKDVDPARDDVAHFVYLQGGLKF